MGMESVELVMEAEDEFGINIPDSEAEKTVTVGQFVDLVYSLLPEEKKQLAADDQICPSHKWFNAVRKVLMEEAGVERAAITPEALLEDLMPRENRSKLWKRIRKALGIYSLLYSGLESKKEIFCTKEMHSFRLYMPERLRSEFPTNCRNVKDLVWQISKAKVRRVYSKHDLSKEDVFNIIKYMIIEIGYDLVSDEIKPESRFVEDLGFG